MPVSSLFPGLIMALGFGLHSAGRIYYPEVLDLIHGSGKPYYTHTTDRYLTHVKDRAEATHFTLHGEQLPFQDRELPSWMGSDPKNLNKRTGLRPSEVRGASERSV